MPKEDTEFSPDDRSIAALLVRCGLATNREEAERKVKAGAVCVWDKDQWKRIKDPTWVLPEMSLIRLGTEMAWL